MIDVNTIYNEDCFNTIEKIIEDGIKIDAILTSTSNNNKLNLQKKELII